MDGGKMKTDPVLHSHVSDVLPDNHPLAFVSVACATCGRMVHAFNNECMNTWIESGLGNFCLICFANVKYSCSLEDDAGLPVYDQSLDKTARIASLERSLAAYRAAWRALRVVFTCVDKPALATMDDAARRHGIKE